MESIVAVLKMASKFYETLKS